MYGFSAPSYDVVLQLPAHEAPAHDRLHTLVTSALARPTATGHGHSLSTILEESGADLLVYGMGEMPLREILRLLKRGVPFASLKTIPQTAVMLPAGAAVPKNQNWEDFGLHSHEECLADRSLYAKNFKQIEVESNRVKARRLRGMMTRMTVGV